MTAPAPTPTDALPDIVDLRLVVTDMDGSLLDVEGRLPPRFGTVLTRMRENDVAFVPASGRQLDNLRTVFGAAIADSPVIAENGTVVSRAAPRSTARPSPARTPSPQCARLAPCGSGDSTSDP